MDKKLKLQVNSISSVLIQLFFLFLFGTIISVIVSQNIADYLILMLGVILTFLICLFLFYLIIRKSGKFSLLVLLLGIFIFLISIGRTSIGSINILNTNGPIHIVVFPFILMLLMSQIYFRKNISIHRRNLLLKEGLFAAFFVVFLIASIYVAGNRNIAIITTVELITYIFIYFVFSFLVTSYHLLIKLIWIYVITTSIVLIYSIYHYIYDPFEYMRLVAKKHSTANANTYALTLLLGFLFLFGLVISESNWKKRIVYIVMLSLFSIGILLTFSRNAWISAFIGVMILLLFSLKNKYYRIRIPTNLITILIILATIISIAFFGIILNNSLIDRIQTVIELNQERAVNSIAARSSIYISTFTIIKESPILGIGLGEAIVPDFRPGHDLTNPHNSYLGVWVGSGIFALIFFLLFLFQHGLNLIKIRKQINRDGVLGNILLASFVAFTTFMLFATSFIDSFLWGALALQGAAIHVYAIEKLRVKK